LLFDFVNFDGSTYDGCGETMMGRRGGGDERGKTAITAAVGWRLSVRRGERNGGGCGRRREREQNCIRGR